MLILTLPKMGHMFKKAFQMDILFQKDDAVVFKFGGFQGYMLNLFNSEACAWMKQIIQTNLVDQDFRDGWQILQNGIH